MAYVVTNKEYDMAFVCENETQLHDQLSDYITYENGLNGHIISITDDQFSALQNCEKTYRFYSLWSNEKRLRIKCQVNEITSQRKLLPVWHVFKSWRNHQEASRTKEIWSLRSIKIQDTETHIRSLGLITKVQDTKIWSLERIHCFRLIES